jgi:hypothetical protein
MGTKNGVASYFASNPTRVKGDLFLTSEETANNCNHTTEDEYKCSTQQAEEENF